jgi:DNA invertase Pin-like site-specific DNA recombinase
MTRVASPFSLIAHFPTTSATSDRPSPAGGWPSARFRAGTAGSAMLRAAASGASQNSVSTLVVSLRPYTRLLRGSPDEQCARDPRPNRYARVSTDEQNLDLRLDALEAAGCKRAFRDVGSGSLKHRPQLDACFDYLRTGDTLVVSRLDRLGRGLKHLIGSIDELHAREIGFRSLTEAIDTTTPAGVCSSTSSARWRSSSARRSGSAPAPACPPRGRLGGRPASLSPEKLAAAEAMRVHQHPMRDIASALRVSRATLYRHLAASDSPTRLGVRSDPPAESRVSRD